MKSFSAFALVLMALTLSSCEAIGDIFGAGMWTGVIMVVLGIALVVWLVSKFFGSGRRSV